MTDDRVVPAAYTLAQRIGCSYYDGLYIALSVARDCPLIHADRNLRGALGGRFPLEVWIEDYHR